MWTRWFGRSRKPATEETSSHDTTLSDVSWLKHEQEAASASVWRMLRQLPGTWWSMADICWRADRRSLVVALMAHTVSGILVAVGLFAVTAVLEVLFAGSGDGRPWSQVLPQLATLAAVHSLKGLADVTAATAVDRLTPAVLRRAERELVGAVSQVELVNLDRSEFHDMFVRARHRGVNELESAAEQAVTLVGLGISLLSSAFVLTALHPILLPLLVVSVIPEGWSALNTARRQYEAVLRVIEARRRFGMLTDLFVDRDSAAEIKAFSARKFLLDEHDRTTITVEREERQAARRNARTLLGGRVFAGIALGLAFTTLVLLLDAGWMSVAAAGASVVAMRSARATLTQVTLTVNRLFDQGLYLNDYFAFIADCRSTPRPALGKKPPADPELVVCRDVHFTYPDSTEPALRGVSLSIERGQTVALVGENGSGKSTLAKVLCGLYHPDRGAVTWDGVDIRNTDPDLVARQISVVMQNPAHWPLSLRDNITLGGFEETDPDQRGLDEAVRGAGVESIVADLPHGWTTLLTKRFRHGHDLSGGQWQRIGIARALYRRTSLLICDEPTAALDARAEAAVFDTLRQLRLGRTVLLITHRLVSTREADLIIVLDRGQIIEQGTHQELMNAGGRYAELYELQAAAYATESPGDLVA